MSILQESGTATRPITVAFILPSGVVVGIFKVNIKEEGHVLEFVVDWPKKLVDIHFMHRKLLGQYYSFKDFHPNVF